SWRVSSCARAAASESASIRAASGAIARRACVSASRNSGWSSAIRICVMDARASGGGPAAVDRNGRAVEVMRFATAEPERQRADFLGQGHAQARLLFAEQVADAGFAVA